MGAMSFAISFAWLQTTNRLRFTTVAKSQIASCHYENKLYCTSIRNCILSLGYRPILDAMKSFAADANPIDIEVTFLRNLLYLASFRGMDKALKSLFINVFLQELSKCSGKCDDCLCKRQGAVPTNSSGVKWYAPKNVEELYAILNKNGKESIKLVAGNTGKGK